MRAKRWVWVRYVHLKHTLTRWKPYRKGRKDYNSTPAHLLRLPPKLDCFTEFLLGINDSRYGVFVLFNSYSDRSLEVMIGADTYNIALAESTTDKWCSIYSCAVFTTFVPNEQLVTRSENLTIPSVASPRHAADLPG